MTEMVHQMAPKDHEMSCRRKAQTEHFLLMVRAGPRRNCAEGYELYHGGFNHSAWQTTRMGHNQCLHDSRDYGRRGERKSVSTAARCSKLFATSCCTFFEGLPRKSPGCS